MSDEDEPLKAGGADDPDESAGTSDELPVEDTGGEELPYPSIEELDSLLPDYQVTEIIGQGGMGVVYLAWQERLERYVAIKVLPKIEAAAAEDEEQFRTEARTMAGLHHTHIVTVYDFGSVDGLHYLVMEHVEGVTLHHHFHEGGYSVSEIIAIILQVCEALEYAHSSGVVHRDIKSANILMGPDGMSKVVDFGLATLQESPGILRRRKLEGVRHGTPGYSAPELFHLGAHVDHRADIYSIAAVLYEGLTGMTLDQPWTSPAGASHAPASIDQVIRKATKKEPKDRYQSVRLFADALRNLKQSAPVPAAGRAPLRRPRRIAPVQPTSKGPVLVLLGSIVGIVIIVLIVISGGGGDDPKGGAATPSLDDLARAIGSEEIPATPDPLAGGKPNPDRRSEVVDTTEESDPIDPVEDPSAPEETVTIPLAIEEAEAELETEMGKLDQLFDDAYEKLAVKYVAALDRLRANAPPAGIQVIESEAKAVRAGEPPPAEDEPGLYAPVARLRPVLRQEYDKLAVPIAGARVKLLVPHIEKVKAIRSDYSDERVIEQIDQTLDAHQTNLDGLQALLASKETPAVDAAQEPQESREAKFKAFKIGSSRTETMAPRGTGLGIFGGLYGHCGREADYLAVPPATREGNWDLVRRSESGSLGTRGIYYENPLLDFSGVDFEVFEWKRGGGKKRLIDGDVGFPMISGVRGRIGGGTDVTLTYEPANHHWYCDGKGSTDATRVIITNVRVRGDTMLKMKTKVFPWKANQRRVKMIHKDEGFCVLTRLHGPFNGGGESVKLSIEPDGYWYLGGHTEAGGVAATATAFIFPKD